MKCNAAGCPGSLDTEGVCSNSNCVSNQAIPGVPTRGGFLRLHQKVVKSKPIGWATGLPPQGKKIINSLFRAKIQELPKNEADFHGNMITIHIPK